MKKKYVFQFTSLGRETFLRLQRNVRLRVEKKLRFFLEAENPLQYALKLKGYDYFRFRVGDYRIIFKKIDQEHFVILLILKVEDRRYVYKGF